MVSNHAPWAAWLPRHARTHAPRGTRGSVPLHDSTCISSTRAFKHNGPWRVWQRLAILFQRAISSSTAPSPSCSTSPTRTMSCPRSAGCSRVARSILSSARTREPVLIGHVSRPVRQMLVAPGSGPSLPFDLLHSSGDSAPNLPQVPTTTDMRALNKPFRVTAPARRRPRRSGPSRPVTPRRARR